MRLFPTKQEQSKLQIMFDQYRWYYNASVNIINAHYGSEITNNNKYNSNSVRDLINKYEYSETKKDNKIIREFKYNETKTKPSVPYWWKDDQPHSRIPRGAYKKFVGNLNSAISNYKNNNITHFNMKFRSKKNPTDYLHFEDKGYPAFINKLKSVYWFRDKNKKRTNISLKEINETTTKRGIEIIFEKHTGKYFLHYPVEVDWYPKNDKRTENQGTFKNLGNRIISLDPGIRKFMVGYDPSGKSVFFGEGAQPIIIKLLYKIDRSKNSLEKYKLWKKVKNLISEMHWKTISYLVRNYDVIMLPDFRVTQMIKKKHSKLKRITKRLMCMYSFHEFKMKLKYKCEAYGKKLIIVDESYTSCTCGRCGFINRLKGKEIFECKECKLRMDRDVGGSRNILLKNISQR